MGQGNGKHTTLEHKPPAEFAPWLDLGNLIGGALIIP
jgi:hypothetical protein